MKRYSALPIILLLLSLSLALFAAEKAEVTVSNQNQMDDDTVLVEYEGGTITRKDLDNRISKIPPNQQGRFRTIEGQIQVLDVLSLENVLLKKAIEMDIENDPEVKERIETGTRQFYIQEYYKRMVVDKVEITEADRQDFFTKNTELFVMLPVITINYISTATEDEAKAALAELNTDISWEEVSNAFSRNNYIKGLKGVIKNIRLNGNIPGVGTDRELEQLIEANLDNLNQIVGPVKTETGWHLFMVTEHIPRRDKSYEEVLPEIEQRLRPTMERMKMEALREELVAKYSVTVDEELAAQIDLATMENNDAIREQFVIEAPQAEISFTVGQILDSFNKLTPQEQIFYIKGEGARAVIDQELSRALMLHDAIEENYGQYVEEKEEFIQMKHYFILNAVYRKLIVDTIEVPQEEIRAYYDSHIADYTTPASRCIQVFWAENMKKAKSARKKFSRVHKLGDEKRMQKIIDKDSKNPNQSIFDHQYNNGIVTGIGPDEEFSKMIWENPVGYLSPVFTTARGDIVFFRTTKENPPEVKSFTEMEPRIFGILKKEKESSQQTQVTNELFEEYNLQKHLDRIKLKLSVEELFNLADDSARMRRFKDAINYYNQIIEHYPNGSDDYKASFMKAFLIAEEMQNTDLALDLFKAFLVKYPSGELNDSAQFMIDTLEGNVELEIEGFEQAPEAEEAPELRQEPELQKANEPQKENELPKVKELKKDEEAKNEKKAKKEKKK